MEFLNSKIKKPLFMSKRLLNFFKEVMILDFVGEEVAMHFQL